MNPGTRAALGLGSNLGDRRVMLQAGVAALLDTPGVTAVAVSPVYETEPVGGPPDQPGYLNAVLVVETDLAPGTLLERANAVEESLGRDRSREVRFGPRTLDVDLLAVGDLVLDSPALVLPHPRLHERAFVLVPWSDVDTSFEVPGLGSVGALAAAVDAAGVRPTDLRLHLS